MNIKGLTVFPKDFLIVLLCENEEQAFELVSLMTENKFRITHDNNNDKAKSILTLTFDGLALRVTIPFKNDLISKYKEVRYITTGFETPSGEIAAMEDDKLSFMGFDDPILN